MESHAKANRDGPFGPFREVRATLYRGVLRTSILLVTERSARAAHVRGGSMNRRATKWGPSARLVLASAVAVLMPAPAARAADPAPLAVTLGAGSVVWLAGTSTVHDF